MSPVELSPTPQGAGAPAPAAARIPVTQTESPARSCPLAALLVSTYQANKLLAGPRDGPGCPSWCHLRPPMGLAADAGGWPSARARGSGSSAQRPGHRPAEWNPRARTMPASCPAQPRHRRHRGPRTDLGRERTVARQHPVLLPVYAGHRLQLRPALAAAVHIRPGGRGSLPSERPGMVEGRPRYATALGQTNVKDGWRAGKATGGVLIDVPSGETIVPRPVHATLPPLARRTTVGAGIRDRPIADFRPQWPV